MNHRSASLPKSPFKGRAFLRRLTRRALLLSMAMVTLSHYASAANTEYDVNKASGTNLTLAGTYTTGGTAGTGANGTTPTNPPSVTSDVTFDSGTYTTTAFTIPTAIAFGSLNDLSTTTLTINNTGGAAASTLTLGGTGNLGDGVPGSNAADLLFVATGATLNITTGTGNATLNLALGQSGNFDVVGTAAISSIISDGGAGFGITKTGAGTLTLSGANTYTGTTGVNGGTLTLSGSISASSALGLGGGTLAFTKTGAGASQTFAGTAINAGQSSITESLATQTLNLGAFTHTTGGTVNLAPTGASVFTTTTANGFGTGTNAIFNGYTTFGGTSWATSASTAGSTAALTSFASYTAANATAATDTGADIDVTTSVTVGGVTSPNSIRFNTGASTLTLATGTNTIASGGILVGSGATSGTISGGTITAGTGNELFVVGSKAATINSIIANNGNAVALTLSDAGGVSLGGANTYTGNTYINSGNVTFANGTTPFGSGGTIFLGASGSTGVVSLISSNLSNTFSNPITVEPGGRREIYTTVGGSPTYSGAITLVGGATLEAGPNSNSNMTFTGGATGTGNIIFGAPQAGRTANIIVSGSNPINITGTISDLDTLSGQNNTGTVTVSAPIQGATAVLQNSTTAQFVLSGTNTYTGSTNITAGTLEFVKAASTGSSPISVGSAGTLAFNVDGNGGITNGTSGAGTLGGLFAGLSGTAGSTVTYTAGSILALDTTNATGGSYSYAGNITTTPTTTLAKIGTGTLIFSGANSYTAATKITAGTLEFENPGAMSGSSAVSVASGAILGVNVGGTGEFATGSTGAGTVAGIFAGTGGQGSAITYTAGSYVGIDTTNATGAYTDADTIGTITPGVAKIGTGTLILSGNNTYTTPTLVNTGTLQAGVASVAGVSGAFGLNSAVTLANVSGATLALNGFNTQIGSLAGGGSTGGNVTLGTATLTTGGDNTTTTYGGVISGTGGSLTKIGTGTLNLNATSTYTGGTTITGGTVFLSSTGGLSSSVAVGTGAFLSIARPASESGTIGASSIISGAGGVVQNINNPNQAFTLDRPNTYTGPTQGSIRGGFIAGVASTFDGNGNQLTGAFGVNSQIQFTSGSAVLALNGYANQVGSLVSSAGTGVIVLGGLGAGRPASVLTIGGDNAPTALYQGIINESSNQNSSFGTAGTFGGSIVKIGMGNQTFSGSSLYAGATTIKGGTLTVTTLTNGGVATTASTADAASTTLNVASTAGLVVGQSLEATGVAIGTPPTITAIGTNSVTLSAAQTIANGTPLYFGNGNGIGISTNAAANLVLDGGTLAYTGATVSTDRLFTVGSTEAGGVTGTLDASGTGALNFTNTGAIAYGTPGQTRTLGLTGTNTGANTLTPVIADNGAGAVAVNKSGVGSWTLAGANTYSGGTTVNAGTLTSTVAGGFGTGNVTINPTGTAGTAADAATLNSLGSIAPTAAVTVNSNSATAVGTLNFNGATPTIGSLTGTGRVVLNNAGGTTLTIGGGVSGNANSTFSGAISQGTAASNLAVSTMGTVTLSGNNTYTGATTVNGGTLALANATGPALSGTTGILVNNGGTLLLAAVNQLNAATPAPVTLGTTGATTPNGILSVTAGSSQGNAETLTGGTAAGGPTTAGLGALTLNNTATLTFGGAATTLVFNGFMPNGNVLTITGYTNSGTATAGNSGGAGDDRLVFFGDQSANLADFNFGAGTTASEIALDNGFYEVTMSAVPEPSTWMGGIACLGFVSYRLVRSRRQARRQVGMAA